MQGNKNYVPRTKMTYLRVNEEAELMSFLLDKTGKSRNAIKSLLGYRQIAVNDKITTQFNHSLKPGDEVSINASRGNTELNHPLLRIIHEDSDFIVAEKEDGLLSVTVGTGRDITAFSILKSYVKKASPANKIYTVHRLDKFTSGVILFSKNRDLQHALRDHWHAIVSKRTYVAVVEGVVEKDSGQIVSWLTEDDIKLKVRSSKFDNGGKQAITHYKVLQRSKNFSLMEVELETGRKNQIRVHMESIGHPIVGDRKYSSRVQHKRIALHANVLEFTHPVTGRQMHFESEIPEEFFRIMRRK